MAIRFLIIFGVLTQQWIALPCVAVAAMQSNGKSCADSTRGMTCCCDMQVELSCCEPQDAAPTQPTPVSIEGKSVAAALPTHHFTLSTASFVAVDGNPPVSSLPTLTAPQRCARLCMWVE